MAQIPDSLSKKVLVLRGGILLVYTLECTLRISKGTGGGVRGGCRSARSIAVFYMWGGGAVARIWSAHSMEPLCRWRASPSALGPKVMLFAC